MALKLPEGMSAVYENSAASSYLVIGAGNYAESILWYQVSMLENNRPENMLPLEIRRKNRTVSFYYDITSRLALGFLLKRKKLKRNEFIKLLADLSRPMVDCEGFLLKDSGFLLDAGFIYVNPENLEVYLAYLPVKIGENTAEAFKSFVMDLILHNAVIEEAGCDNFLQRIIGFLKRDVFSIKEFQRLLEELLCGSAVPEETPAGTATGALVEGLPDKNPVTAACPEKDKTRSGPIIAVAAQALIIVILLLCRKLIAGIPGNTATTYGAIALLILSADLLLFKKLFAGKAVAKVPETGSKKPERLKPDKMEKAEMKVAAGSLPEKQEVPATLTGIRPETPLAIKAPVQAKTELLTSAKPGVPILRSANTAADLEEIRIDRPEFIIGRLADQVDHVCRNNAVGKVHAMITVKGGILRIRDLNSVNGTFVNNIRIESNRDVEIRDNDAIALANSEYVLVNK